MDYKGSNSMLENWTPTCKIIKNELVISKYQTQQGLERHGIPEHANLLQ